LEFYIEWVKNNPILSAAIQFAILGTLGEILSVSLRKKKAALPGTLLQTLGKVAAWALLGIIIKYGFAGMKGFTAALIQHSLLPQFLADGIGWAFAVSVLTNIFFGPQMMFFHRIEDNIILGERNFDGLTKAWWTLLWFWIPAHTVTFSLPVEYQIGLAALWSVVLGLIMGLTKKEKPKQDKKEQ
jgi:hypothetical protein